MSTVMTPEEFQTWSQRLQLTPETVTFITAIRQPPPVRRVKGRVNNVTGRYPSHKMSHSIQFESEHVELWAIYRMERDDDVLEYYDQSSRIPLSYRAKSGRHTTQWHTPDFFVLRTTSAGWEEWKPALALDDLTVSMPARYQQTGTGQWRCLPEEAYAAQFGLYYRLRSSAEYHRNEIQNLKFLQNFWAHEVPPQPEQEARILALISAHPGIPLSELLSASPDLPVDSVWTLISQRRVWTSFSATLLTHHDQVILYGEEGEANRTSHCDAVPPEMVLPASPLAWDGRLWQVEAMTDPVQLRPEVGEVLLLPLAEFEYLRAQGLIWEVNSASPSPTSPHIRETLAKASPKAQHEANRRLAEMLAYARGESVTASLRSVRERRLIQCLRQICW
jgi:putative transposase